MSTASKVQNKNWQITENCKNNKNFFFLYFPIYFDNFLFKSRKCKKFASNWLNVTNTCQMNQKC